MPMTDAFPPPGSADGPTELDLRGLRCPMPVLRTRKALAQLRPGRQLVVLSTDPLASLDIPHLVAGTGDLLVEQFRDGSVFGFRIKKT